MIPCELVEVLRLRHMRHFCLAFKLQHQDGGRQENTHNDLKERHKIQEINLAVIAYTWGHSQPCTNPVQFHWPGREPLVWGISITLLQPPKKCVALDCFVALKSVMVSGNTLDMAPYDQRASVAAISSSGGEPAMQGSESWWGGTEGCWENGNSKKTLTKCILLTSSHSCFCKEVNQKQVLSSHLSFLSQMCMFQSILKHICLKLH